ncbi:MAG: HAD-IA family hydrolase [Nevskiales bacterium]|nr:HAD-IA family hydrolase [Nevskiales bacterium]
MRREAQKEKPLGTVSVPSPVRCVLFDLDGTLVDTAPDLARAANRVRADAGLPPLPGTHYRAVASGGTRGLLKAALNLLPEHPDFARQRDRFLSYYQADLSRESSLFPGMDETLAAFEKRNIRWGVVTNKPEWLAQPLIKNLGLAGRINCVVGSTEGLPLKPAPDPLLKACVQLNLGVKDCVYVGDDRRDVEAARAAHMPVIAAAWGYLGVNESVEEWRADAVAQTPADLIPLCT